MVNFFINGSTLKVCMKSGNVKIDYGGVLTTSTHLANMNHFIAKFFSNHTTVMQQETVHIELNDNPSFQVQVIHNGITRPMYIPDVPHTNGAKKTTG